MKKTCITVSGSIGSGKTTTANELARRLGYQRFSAGDFMRNLAQEKGMTLLELSKDAEFSKTIDETIDTALRACGDIEHIVIDSRLGFHFIPDSFKVYLFVPDTVAAERIQKDIETNPLRTVEKETTYESILDALVKRAESEKKRYNDHYGISVSDKENFDLYLSSEHASVDAIVSEIVRAYTVWQHDTQSSVS